MVTTDFALRLPGFTLPIMNYWDGQGLRYAESLIHPVPHRIAPPCSSHLPHYLLSSPTLPPPPPPPNLSALPHHTRIATSHAQSHTNPHCSPSQARNIKSQTPKSPSSEANTIPTMIFFSQENAKALTQPKIHAQEPRHRHSALRRPIHAIPQGRRR